MKLKRSVVERIIREELAAHVRSLVEKEKQKGASVVDAHADKKDDKEETKPQRQPGNVAKKDASAQKKKPEAQKDAEPPADEERPEVPSDEPEGDSEPEEAPDEPKPEEERSKVRDELVGKTIQSVSYEAKSKLMPGAMEITIYFDQVPDPFRILLTKSGKIAYYWKGLHNEI